MITYPRTAKILSRSPRADIDGVIRRLDSDTAAKSIDGQWWRDIPSPKRLQPHAYDSHWVWATEMQRVAAYPLMEGVYLEARRRTQGAMIYRFDGQSRLASGEKSVYVEFLATAPWNRDELVSCPEFDGVGRALVKHAVLHSHAMGLKGRVLVASVPSDDALGFYENLAFTPLGECIDCGVDLPLYELSEKHAASHLV